MRRVPTEKAGAGEDRKERGSTVMHLPLPPPPPPSTPVDRSFLSTDHSTFPAVNLYASANNNDDDDEINNNINMNNPSINDDDDGDGDDVVVDDNVATADVHNDKKPQEQTETPLSPALTAITSATSTTTRTTVGGGERGGPVNHNNKMNNNHHQCSNNNVRAGGGRVSGIMKKTAPAINNSSNNNNNNINSSPVATTGNKSWKYGYGAAFNRAAVGSSSINPQPLSHSHAQSSSTTQGLSAAAGGGASERGGERAAAAAAAGGGGGIEGKAHTKKRQPKIQWDEVTIAEHDKERGTRQRIDEAPTPFRYGSESDQSDFESGSDAGDHLSLSGDSYASENALSYHSLCNSESNSVKVSSKNNNSKNNKNNSKNNSTGNIAVISGDEMEAENEHKEREMDDSNLSSSSFPSQFVDAANSNKNNNSDSCSEAREKRDAKEREGVGERMGVECRNRDPVSASTTIARGIGAVKKGGGAQKTSAKKERVKFVNSPATTLGGSSSGRGNFVNDPDELANLEGLAQGTTYTYPTAAVHQQRQRDMIQNSWETLHAKLEYERQLQLQTEKKNASFGPGLFRFAGGESEEVSGEVDMNAVNMSVDQNNDNDDNNNNNNDRKRGEKLTISDQTMQDLNAFGECWADREGNTGGKGRGERGKTSFYETEDRPPTQPNSRKSHSKGVRILSISDEMEISQEGGNNMKGVDWSSSGRGKQQRGGVIESGELREHGAGVMFSTAASSSATHEQTEGKEEEREGGGAYGGAAAVVVVKGGNAGAVGATTTTTTTPTTILTTTTSTTAAGAGPNKRQFKNKRAKHYNEFQVMLAMRKRMKEEEAEVAEMENLDDEEIDTGYYA